MLINVCFDLHVSVISCDNIDRRDIDRYAKEFENYIYKPTNGSGVLIIKNEIGILDVNTLINWLNISYPKLNAKVITEKVQLEFVDCNLPSINL